MGKQGLPEEVKELEHFQIFLANWETIHHSTIFGIIEYLGIMNSSRPAHININENSSMVNNTL